jgi:hypothetical protein
VAQESLQRTKKPQALKKETTAMKTTNHFSPFTSYYSRSASILTALALGAFALSPKVRAVSPPPDGGYAGGNTAEGKTPFLASLLVVSTPRSGSSP